MYMQFRDIKRSKEMNNVSVGVKAGGYLAVSMRRPAAANLKRAYRWSRDGTRENRENCENRSHGRRFSLAAISLSGRCVGA